LSGKATKQNNYLVALPSQKKNGRQNYKTGAKKWLLDPKNV